MRSLAPLILCLPLAVAGCGGAVANNVTNAVNVVAEEGIEDVNSSIEGDQLAPDLEAVDDMAGNNAAKAPPAPPQGK